jgi:hypothetical protein
MRYGQIPAGRGIQGGTEGSERVDCGWQDRISPDCYPGTSATAGERDRSTVVEGSNTVPLGPRRCRNHNVCAGQRAVGVSARCAPRHAFVVGLPDLFTCATARTYERRSPVREWTPAVATLSKRVVRYASSTRGFEAPGRVSATRVSRSRPPSSLADHPGSSPEDALEPPGHWCPRREFRLGP